jgi:cephalosporin hydroxylase
MDQNREFKEKNAQKQAQMLMDSNFIENTKSWIFDANRHEYSYKFTCLGRPIIQYPQDMIAMQELIWEVKPDLILEFGIAHGGSLIMSAQMLTIIEYSEAVNNNQILDPNKPKRKVLGIDIDIRKHNKIAIEQHPMSNRIDMIQGSSIDQNIIDQVHTYAKDYKNILISLDSNHTHDHVLAELEAYANLISINSYCVVFDTLIEDLPANYKWPNRSWGKGNNPKTAVHKFLETNDNFIIDKDIDNKLLISVAPDGYLKRIK